MVEQQISAEIFDPLVRCMIRRSARSVVLATGLPSYEQEDIEQDLRLHYWLQRDFYHPSRGARSTFAKVVIRRKAAALAIRARAGCRLGVHVPIAGDGLPDLDPNAPEARMLGASIRARGRADAALLALHLDVRRAVRRLAKGDRRLAQRLMRSRVAEIAQTTGMPKSTIYDRIKRVREAFVAAGICPRPDETRTVFPSTE